MNNKIMVCTGKMCVKLNGEEAIEAVAVTIRNEIDQLGIQQTNRGWSWKVYEVLQKRLCRDNTAGYEQIFQGNSRLRAGDRQHGSPIANVLILLFASNTLYRFDIGITVPRTNSIL